MRSLGLVSSHLQDDDAIAAGVGDRAKRLHLIGRYRGGAISPSAAHETQHTSDLIVGQLNAELRHAIGIWRTLHHERRVAVQDDVDERGWVAIGYRRIAGERRNIRALDLAAGAVARRAISEVNRCAGLLRPTAEKRLRRGIGVSERGLLLIRRQ